MEYLQTTEFAFRAGSPAQRRPGAGGRLQQRPGTVRLGHLSDLHLGKPTADAISAKEAVEVWLQAFEAAGVEVLVFTGDVVEARGDRPRLAWARDRLDEVSFPYVIVPGNHDQPEPGSPGPFEAIFGHYPAVSTEAGVEFVLLDSMKGLPPSERSRIERQEAADSAYSRGRVGQAQREAAAQMLGDTPGWGRVMVVHHHLRPNAPSQVGWEQEPTAPHGLMAPLDDADPVLRWATEHGVRLAFHGHKHNFWEPYEPRPGLVVLNSGTSFRGKPDRARRARIVDVWPSMERIAVHDVQYD